MAYNAPYLGHGVGLRAQHFDDFLHPKGPPVDFCEAISENFFQLGGRSFQVLERVRSCMPVTLHGVSLSIASTVPLNVDYLGQLKALIDRIQPAIVSDHIGWTKLGDNYAHDLLPFPYTEEALHHVAERIMRVQDFLGRQIIIENAASYMKWSTPALDEGEFLTALAERADCGLLLDLTNVLITARNVGTHPMAYLRGLPPSRVAQIHLAGREEHPSYWLDTHDHPVPDDAWAFYKTALEHLGHVSTVVEWDMAVPAMETVLAEHAKARAVAASAKVGSVPATPPASKPHPKSSVTLQQTQAALWHYLSQADVDAPPAALLVQVSPAVDMDAKASLRVYHDIYWMRLMESMQEVFPTLRRYLGDAAFRATGQGYLRAHPSHDPDVSMVGQHLVDYLQERDAIAADMATLDWLTACLLTPAPAQAVTQRALPPPPCWDRVTLAFVDTMTCTDLSHDITALWRSLRDPQGPRAAAVPGPVRVAIWRERDGVAHKVLPAHEDGALRLAASGLTVAQLSHLWMQAQPPTAFQVMVRKWFERGWVKSVNR